MNLSLPATVIFTQCRNKNDNKQKNISKYIFFRKIETYN